MNKVLTVVVPTYNMEYYLKNTLDSLIVSPSLMQFLEVIVVNDGSKDKSSLIAHEYVKQYPDSFRVIDKENGNYGSCVNRGLKEAKGKYIKILDADDQYNSEVFSSFLSYLNGCDSDMVLSDFVQVNPEGNVINHIHYGLDTTRDLSCKDLPKEKLFLNPAVTYKTDNLRRMKYHQTEGISYTDQEWVFMPMLSVYSIRYFSGIVYKYLIGREGQTMDPLVFKKNLSQIMQVTMSIMHCFEVHHKSIDNQHYAFFVNRIELACHVVYDRFLIVNDLDLDIRDLNYFDNRIKQEYPCVWSIMNSMRISPRINYRYIKDYRRFHKNCYPGILLYRFYRKLKTD